MNTYYLIIKDSEQGWWEVRAASYQLATLMANLRFGTKLKYVYEEIMENMHPAGCLGRIG